MTKSRYFSGLITLLLCASPCLGDGDPARLSIQKEKDQGPPRLQIDGLTTGEYLLEASSDPALPNSWEFLLGLSLTNPVQDWFDRTASGLNKRFYRTTHYPVSLPAPPAEDFRLTDHDGRTHSLFYHSNARAIVLIFSDANCQALDAHVSALNGLQNRFGPQGVLFWVLSPAAPTNRAALASKVAQLGLRLPVLEDADFLVAHAFKAQAMPEVAVVNPAEWNIFYRGAIEDAGLGENNPPNAPIQRYLESALENFLAGRPVSPHHTTVQGCPVENPAPGPISYSTQIAPILQARCARCHSIGDIAPWAMTNYTSVQVNAESIKVEVLANRMPPWHADPAYSAFANDFSLRPAEKSALLQWIDQGAPRGEGPDPLTQLPPPPAEWVLGPPTTVLSIPKQSIPANGIVAYRYIDVTTSFPTDVWLQGAVVRPGNRRVVHHCLVYFGSTSFLMGLDGFFAGFVPGYDPVLYPPGTGKFLPKGTVLRFQMHYTTSGNPETDQTQLGLYLAPAPPAYALQTKSTFNIPFTLRQTAIPPGDPDYEMTAEYEFSNNVLLYEMSPHMHLRGSRFKYEAIYPDNSRETLLSVPHYDFDWQTLYRFAEPKRLPAGTRLWLTAAWDNSPQNFNNPDPQKLVKFGEQTFDEMFIGYFNFAEVP